LFNKFSAGRFYVPCCAAPLVPKMGWGARSVLAAAAAALAAASTVYGVEANAGSLGGATRVTLWGAGFVNCGFRVFGGARVDDRRNCDAIGLSG
jgi:hypothetical protein